MTRYGRKIENKYVWMSFSTVRTPEEEKLVWVRRKKVKKCPSTLSGSKDGS